MFIYFSLLSTHSAHCLLHQTQYLQSLTQRRMSQP